VTTLRPGQQYRIWPPISSTLIAGRDSAVLVDAPITTTQAGALAYRVAATGKSLTGIYITHGHPDHWFGASVRLDRFPDARMVATPAVVRQMRRYLAAEALSLWRRRFPGQIPANPAVAAELGPQVIELEGHQLTPVTLGHTDMDDTTCLHVPSARLGSSPPATPCTTASVLSCANRAPPPGASGSPRWTPSSPSGRQSSSPAINDQAQPTSREHRCDSQVHPLL
jgi:hypothetical protein